ncbi:MAG TPA: response regulator [Verrucomicrobiae bacterium]|nr:response regulator [Verrucomicrobiae bacterium]
MSTHTTTKPSVLLVEDSEDDAYFFKRTLQKSGHTCVFNRAANGAEAVEFLQTASTSSSQTLPHVMFLDLKMPVLNGFEVLDWLKHQSFASQVRVIVLSGSEHQNDKDRAAKLGASDYLVKPVRAGDLNRFLNEICPADTGKGTNP